MIKTNSLITRGITAAVLLSAAFVSAATVVYVKPDGNAAVDGKGGWGAATTLANALSKQNNATAPVEIWVAKGSYSPNQSDRTNSFIINSGALLYGGFTGTETSLNQRDWRRQATILDGKNNTYNVIRSLKGTNIRLDGFIIQNGKANIGG